MPSSPIDTNCAIGAMLPSAKKSTATTTRKQIGTKNAETKPWRAVRKIDAPLIRSGINAAKA